MFNFNKKFLLSIALLSSFSAQAKDQEPGRFTKFFSSLPPALQSGIIAVPAVIIPQVVLMVALNKWAKTASLQAAFAMQKVPTRCPFACFSQSEELTKEIIIDSINLGTKPAGGSVILYGPPGNGKSQFVEEVALDTGSILMSVSPASLFKPAFSGQLPEDPSVRLKSIYEVAVMLNMMTKRKIIVFLDEADFVFFNRVASGANLPSKTLCVQALEIIAETNEKNPNIITMLATNFLDIIDTAVLRDGRAGTAVLFKNPDKELALQIMIKYLTQYSKLKITDAITNQILDQETYNQLEGLAQISTENGGIPKAGIIAAFKRATVQYFKLLPQPLQTRIKNTAVKKNKDISSLILKTVNNKNKIKFLSAFEDGLKMSISTQKLLNQVQEVQNVKDFVPSI